MHSRIMLIGEYAFRGLSSNLSSSASTGFMTVGLPSRNDASHKYLPVLTMSFPKICTEQAVFHKIGNDSFFVLI